MSFKGNVNRQTCKQINFNLHCVTYFNEEKINFNEKKKLTLS